MWTFYWTAAGELQEQQHSCDGACRAAAVSHSVCRPQCAAYARTAAGFTLPFAMKAIIERTNPPETKNPPTVKEVRAFAV